MITSRASARILAAALLVVGLAGCSGPGGPSGPGPDNPGPDDPGPGQEIDPWLADDLDLDAAVIAAQYEGLELAGFSCDVTQSLGAQSDLDAIPYATVVVTTNNSALSYRDPGGISSITGPSVLPAGAQETVSVAGEGRWHIGDGGANTPWSSSIDLALTAVPVPEDGCPAADAWAVAMIDVGTDTAEIIRAFTEEGLRNVAGECPDAWFTWVPPNLTCEEFEALTG